jgi:hypothetical protein
MTILAKHATRRPSGSKLEQELKTKTRTKQRSGGPGDGPEEGLPTDVNSKSVAVTEAADRSLQDIDAVLGD